MQAVVKEESGQIQKRQFCTFRIFGRHYGVDILDVKEISSNIDSIPIYHSPREIKGYVNIRGQIYLLLDLRLILGFDGNVVDEASRVVLFKHEVGEPFGILVDRIDDIVTIDKDKIEDRRRRVQEAPEGTERRAVDLAEGVCKLKEGLLVIISAFNLLNSIEGRKAS